MAPIYIYRKPVPFHYENFNESKNESFEENKSNINGEGNNIDEKIKLQYELHRMQNKIDFYESIFIIGFIILIVKFIWDMFGGGKNNFMGNKEKIYVMYADEMFGGGRRMNYY